MEVVLGVLAGLGLLWFLVWAFVDSHESDVRIEGEQFRRGWERDE